MYIHHCLILTYAIETQSEDWHAQVDGIPGGAVRAFDTLEAAENAYEDARRAGLVLQVDRTGERRVLTEQEGLVLPGMQGTY